FKVKLGGILFYPISKLVGYFPGKFIGFGGREARSVMKDGCSNALTGSYEKTDADFNYELALNTVNIPVLAMSIENDFLARKQSLKNLYSKFSKEAEIVHFHITENISGINSLDHFSWVKKSEYIVNIISGWLYG
ncbi:MAG: hypothetical protein M3512_09890, partial [Bacteroidota bacterium]|nr:hypothetical protein [Bacteroidota bacterium]